MRENLKCNPKELAKAVYFATYFNIDNYGYQRYLSRFFGLFENEY
jgi:hypothetical protein